MKITNIDWSKSTENEYLCLDIALQGKSIINPQTKLIVLELVLDYVFENIPNTMFLEYYPMLRDNTFYTECMSNVTINIGWLEYYYQYSYNTDVINITFKCNLKGGN